MAPNRLKKLESFFLYFLYNGLLIYIHRSSDFKSKPICEGLKRMPVGIEYLCYSDGTVYRIPNQGPLAKI